MSSPPARARSAALTVLAIVAAGYAAHAGRSIVVPAVIAIVLNTLLSPAIRGLERARIPPPLGAAILVLGLIIIVAGLGYAVAEPTAEWVDKAPAALDSAATRVQSIGRRVAAVSRQAQQAQQAAGVGGPRRTPVSTGPSVLRRLFGTATALVAGVVEVVLLLYFLLASQDLYPRRLVALLPGVDDAAARRIAHAVEHMLSRYMVTEAALNIALGAEVTLALWLLKMPTPWLWGSIAAVLAFIPYVGSLLLLGVLAVVALTVMPSPSRALAVPVTYFVLNFISANLVTPVVLGRRLTLHPVAILAGLTFWWAMWGIPGAFLSVPILATLQVLSDEVPALARLGDFLSGKERRPPAP